VKLWSLAKFRKKINAYDKEVLRRTFGPRRYEVQEDRENVVLAKFQICNV
jgi:hypothetical protein